MIDKEKRVFFISQLDEELNSILYTCTSIIIYTRFMGLPITSKSHYNRLNNIEDSLKELEQHYKELYKRIDRYFFEKYAQTEENKYKQFILLMDELETYIYSICGDDYINIIKNVMKTKKDFIYLNSAIFKVIEKITPFIHFRDELINDMN